MPVDGGIRVSSSPQRSSSGSIPWIARGTESWVPLPVVCIAPPPPVKRRRGRGVGLPLQKKKPSTTGGGRPPNGGASFFYALLFHGEKKVPARKMMTDCFLCTLFLGKKEKFLRARVRTVQLCPPKKIYIYILMNPQFLFFPPRNIFFLRKACTDI